MYAQLGYATMSNFFFVNDRVTIAIYSLSLPDGLPILLELIDSRGQKMPKLTSSTPVPVINYVCTAGVSDDVQIAPDRQTFCYNKMLCMEPCPYKSFAPTH